VAGGAASRFVVWGHSQGGQAALFTGLIARAYAPDLTLLGVAAAAPASDLAALLEADLAHPAGRNLAAITLWSWARVFDAPIDQVVEPAAMPAIDRLAQACIESIGDILARRRLSRGLPADFLSVPDPARLQPWTGLLAANTPGTLPPDLPIFLAQGDADKLVPPAITRDYALRLCAAGSPVTMLVMPKIKHGFIAAKSARAAVAWMADRFAAAPPANGCAAI
jgi:acetyl esterase/lipase